MEGEIILKEIRQVHQSVPEAKICLGEGQKMYHEIHNVNLH